MQIDKKLLEISEDIKILIVEDSKVSREYTRQILSKYYKNLIIANDGKDGLEKFKNFLPDIVITDIRMPEIDGLTMLKLMKEIHKDFYSIILSAYDEKDLLKESIVQGVVRYITKPVDINELIKTIESIKKTIIITQKLNLQNLFIENILNSLEIIVVISNGNELFALNSYGLNIVGYNSIEEFKRDHKCICEFFIKEAGFIENNPDWLKKLEEMETENRKVKIYDQQLKGYRIFFVNSKDFLDNKDIKIITFYDITIQEKQKEELKKMATIDFLTKIYNRHHFYTILEFQLEKQVRYNDNLFGIIIMDLDHFKFINDHYGHLVGDEVLKEFASIIKNNIRKSDFFARWGGEEFIILVPETTKSQLIAFGEKLRLLVENHFKNHKKLPEITVSLGLTIYKNNDTIHSLIERADEALYLAKNNGRNRVEFL